MDRRRERDRGQAALLVVVVTAVLGVTVMAASVDMGRHLIERTRAQTAADAAALAGVIEGRAAAERMAARHGGAIVEWAVEPDGAAVTVTVTVRIGDSTADARATDEP